MNHNLSVNDDLCKKSNTAEEFRKDSVTDMMVFSEDITITKTEVKEECYDFDMPIDDMEFGYIKEEYISSPENNFREENLGSMTGTQQPRNENVEDITITKTEVKEECYDFKMRVDDLELGNIAKEYISLSVNNIRKENLQSMKSTKQTSNEDVVSGNCQIRDDDLQKKQKLSKNRLGLKRNKAERNNTLKCTLVKQDGESKNHKYGDCKYATKYKCDLEKHICTHTNCKPFKCRYKYCKCTPGKKETCKCKTSGYEALAQSYLKMHILGKDSGKQKKYKCAACKYTTPTRSHLEVHIRTHTNDRPFRCTYKDCECTPEQKRTCKCNTCGYASSNQSNLNAHILVKHSGKQKKYKCADCKYETHIKSNLNVHIRTHSNDRPFKCKYKNCKCAPEQKETCKCNTCGYAASHQSHLKKHVLVKHIGKQKKYKCADCEYATHLKSTLKAHIYRHTNDRPFKCTYKNCECTPEQKETCKCNTCGYATSRKYSLKMHILVKHGENQKSTSVQIASMQPIQGHI